jgi:SAM-dependent methyltransferase
LALGDGPMTIGRSRDGVPGAERESHYSTTMYENSGFPELVRLIHGTERRVIDVGCGTGGNLQLLRESGHEVVGVTVSSAEARVVDLLGFHCVVCDVEREIPELPRESFDVLLLSHVVEHFAWPGEVLGRLLSLVRPGGAVVAAVPNCLAIRNRMAFMTGRFRYTNSGLMDRSHLRFFDFWSAQKLLVDLGLTVTVHRGVGQVPLGPLRRLSKGLSMACDRYGTKVAPGLFAVHVLLRAEKAAS